MTEQIRTLQHTELSLREEFTDILHKAGVEAGVLEEQVEEGKQHKYRIQSTLELKKRLLDLDAIAQYPVEQTDFYFLYPNQSPDFTTESLCWREERRYVEYDAADQQAHQTVGQLIYKTNPHVKGSSHQRTVRRVYLHDEENQLQVLAKVKEIRKGNDFAPYAVSKRRTSYVLPLGPDMGKDSVVIHVDEDVQLSSRTNDSDYFTYHVGNFVEVTIPNSMPDKSELITSMIGIKGEPFDMPYIAKDAFINELHIARPNELSLNSERAEVLWLRTTNKPYYYDANRDEFVLGLDPIKVKRFNKHELVLVRKELEQICTDLDQNDGGRTLASRPSGKGSGSSTYERLTGHDGFINYPTMRSAFKTVELYRKRWQPTDRRIVFSRVIFADAEQSTGVFVHFVGTHTAYEGWLRRHAR